MDASFTVGRRRLLTTAALAPAAALLGPAARVQAAPAAPTAPVLVPYPMDSSNQAAWWTPVATYRGAGEYTYFAFDEPGSSAATHKVAIARRDPAGQWTRIPVMQGGAQAEFTDDLGHNQPSIARDGSGRFHVFASMHNNPWRYFRSDTTGSTPVDHSADLPDQGAGVTYPVVATAPDGDVWLIARIDEADRRTGRLYRWHDAQSRWSRAAVFAGAAGRAVYPDDLQFDTAGNVHLLFQWSRFPSSAFRHELSYLKYAPATGAFTDSRGAAVAAPVSPATADVLQPLGAGEVYSSDNTYTGPAVQSAKLTLNGATPRVAYRYRPTDGGSFQVRYAYPKGTAWARQIVHGGSGTRAALGITWDADERKRVYYVTESGADRAFVATESGGAWTSATVAPGLPVDRLAVRRNASGQDVLYLVDTAGGRLFYGRNP